MVASIIDGKAYADGLGSRIMEAVSPFKARLGRVPGLAVVLVGNDPASEIYVRSKGRKARELGLESFEYILPENIMRIPTKSPADSDLMAPGVPT